MTDDINKVCWSIPLGLSVRRKIKLCFCSACVYSVVSTAMTCFHKIQREIADRCPGDIELDGSSSTAADEYQLLYIRPLVEQSRETVVSRCAMSQPYEQYFRSGAAPPGGRCTNYCCRTPIAFITATLVALSMITLQSPSSFSLLQTNLFLLIFVAAMSLPWQYGLQCRQR